MTASKRLRDYKVKLLLMILQHQWLILQGNKKDFKIMTHKEVHINYSVYETGLPQIFVNLKLQIVRAIHI